MSTTNRMQPWKSGDIVPVVSRAKISGVNIAKGDMVGQAAGTITGATSAASITVGTPFPASDTPWDTNLATTQEAFHDAFLGISHQRSQGTDLSPVQVATRGVHEFDCASAAFKLGDLVGPAKQSGNLLEDQKVVAVATENLATGRIAKDYPSAVTKVLVEVFSVKMSGGVQAMA